MPTRRDDMSAGADGALPDAAYATALCAVEGLGPSTLRRLLASASPEAIWNQVSQGHPDDRGHRWRKSAGTISVAALWRLHRTYRIEATVQAGSWYPEALAGDPEPPAVLFSRGDLSVLGDRPRVAVVGARNATRYGLSLAAELGSGLTAAGVAVVSGLAVGVDTAAHEGACAACLATKGDGVDAAPPIGVLAGGLDVPYPESNTRLFERVAELGIVLSESPAGVPPARWRFPVRNRLMAALSDVVVVVECQRGGGSLHTVQAADRRGVPVGAVPGSVRSPASAGTNDLLADGCFVVRDVTDVLVAVDLARAGAEPVRLPTSRELGRSTGGTSPPGRGQGPRDGAGRVPARGPGSDAPAEHSVAAPEAVAGEGAPAQVLAALGWEPASMERLMMATGLSLAAVSRALEHLAAAGQVSGEAGWWQRA